jgi:Flp pilus assembly protein TadD
VPPRLRQNSATTRDGSTRTAAAQPSVADPATRSREAYKEGNASLFSGQTEAAIKAYQEAVRLNHKDPAGYRGLGLAYAQAGRRTEAASAFQRYLKLARTAKDRDIIKKRIQLLTSH